MTRHQSYSKRSRESRKAMNDDTVDGNVDDDYADCCGRIAAEDWSPLADEFNWPPDPVS